MGFAVLAGMIMTLVAMMLVFQIIIFEMSRKRAVETNNSAWFMSLDKPFNYSRTGSMVVICLIVYVFSSEEQFLSANWFLQLIFLIAIAIISDALVQYLTLHYARLRCRKQIREAESLNDEVTSLTFEKGEDENFEKSMPQYDFVSLAKERLNPTDHLAFITVDKGVFAKNFGLYPSHTFDVEPFAETEEVQANLGDLPVRATKLTSENKMPFKDDRMDIIINELCNYDKNEIVRVLKPGGLFVVEQNGTDNLIDVMKMFVPTTFRGAWDMENCKKTLESVGFKVEDAYEDRGYIRFRNLNQVRTFFKKHVAPEFDDVNRFSNLYIEAQRQIEANGYYQVGTYRFMVVARLTDQASAVYDV